MEPQSAHAPQRLRPELLTEPSSTGARLGYCVADPSIVDGLRRAFIDAPREVLA